MEQHSAGAHAQVFETPISDHTNRTLTNLTKADLSKYIRSILAESCQDNVSEEYVKDSINSNTTILVMFRKVRERVNVRYLRSTRRATEVVDKIIPMGFILAFPHFETLHYLIDVICAIQNTRELLKYFIESCEGLLNIELHALPSVLTFYPKFNFQFRKSCNEPPLTQLPKKLAMRDPRTHPFPKQSEEAYEDEDFSDFMVELVEKGLSVNKEGECGKNGKISKDDLKKGDCGSHGFIMARCVTSRGGKRKTRRNRRRR